MARIKVEAKGGPNSPQIAYDRRHLKEVGKKSSNLQKGGTSPEPAREPSIKALLFMRTLQQSLSPPNNYRDLLPAKVITMQLPE